ncbi:hypothetical protein MUK42_15578 [Musa troglodytarum]|uniref:Uncharacterized protein n=1 Tax=Musa troglodytarum TaxID=320322 RepID=A0A9E7HZE6_9LILI|nr:hypothetical protein MUK42_15578 [Musa troglodytarum]
MPFLVHAHPPCSLPLKIELTRSRNNIPRSPFSRFRSICTSAEFFRNVAWWKFSKLLFLHFCTSLFFSRFRLSKLEVNLDPTWSFFKLVPR